MKGITHIHVEQNTMLEIQDKKKGGDSGIMEEDLFTSFQRSRETQCPFHGA